MNIGDVYKTMHEEALSILPGSKAEKLQKKTAGSPKSSIDALRRSIVYKIVRKCENERTHIYSYLHAYASQQFSLLSREEQRLYTNKRQIEAWSRALELPEETQTTIIAMMRNFYHELRSFVEKLDDLYLLK